jgi:TPR repeat protein
MMLEQRPHALTTPESPKMTRLVPFERHLSALRWQFIRGMLMGVLVSSGVGIAAFEYLDVRQHKPAPPNASEQMRLGNTDAQPAPGAQKPTSETDRTSFSPPISPPIPPKPKTPVNRPAPLTDLSDAQPRATKRSLSTLAQLWASFETGDTKAAVALADLYMRGDGVPANCEQARVLLFVASKENNAEATKKLQDLDEAGCPAP